MKGLNSVQLIGNLGADPEIRHTANDLVVANLRIATSYKGKDGEHTEWHSIVAFGKLAQIIADYVTKGSRVYVQGRLQTRKWQDKNGNDRYTTEIVANDLIMLDSKADAKQQRPRPAAATPAPAPDFDDEIPF